MSGIPYNSKNLRIIQTYEFKNWFNEQKPELRNRILRRLVHITEGNFGDFKSFEGLVELRWKNGLRIYGFIKDGNFFIVLIGGNKNGQKWDIRKAKKIKEEIANGTRSIITSSS